MQPQIRMGLQDIAHPFINTNRKLIEKMTKQQVLPDSYKQYITQDNHIKTNVLNYPETIKQG